jgi:hypothetical protein
VNLARQQAKLVKKEAARREKALTGKLRSATAQQQQQKSNLGREEDGDLGKLRVELERERADSRDYRLLVQGLRKELQSLRRQMSTGGRSGGGYKQENTTSSLVTQERFTELQSKLSRSEKACRELREAKVCG